LGGLEFLSKVMNKKYTVISYLKMNFSSLKGKKKKKKKREKHIPKKIP
jgi:hypothetical protein